MKQIVALVLLVTATAHAEDNLTKVVEVPNATKDQVFDGTKIWVAKTFKSAKAVIEAEDKNAGLLIGNGISAFPCSGFMSCIAKQDWRYSYTMQVDMKDGKFRLSFSNLKLLLPKSGEVPMSDKDDVAAVTPGLFAFGDEIAKAVEANKTAQDW